ncbi:MAG: DNA polymerase III subunit gamma/tau [Dehalococcoidia bacterium]|nr:DNA polymerase III subunit gamma/tau [Dehalococcoidia bacterium]
MSTESQVFYRKWRPQTFAELIGQEHATRTLLNALQTGRVAHAYLFCGPRGTGKTSTGRILAKAVNCQSGGKGEPCNTCDICVSVNDGRALDLVEVDAASNRGIDEIRELRERVKFAPHLGRKRVYIIDEVHMLTDAASNALLKTLEEPPPYIMFILATTEPHKLLPTLLSRSQRFDFHRISQADVVSRLAFVSQKEGIETSSESLMLIARGSGGSLRDAENTLEQLTAYYGSRIELAQVKETLGITGDARARELAGQIVKKDIPAGLATISSVNIDGLDLRQFTRELVEYLRQLLLMKAGSATSGDLTFEEAAEAKIIVAGTSLDHILKAVRLFGGIDLRLDNFSSLPLEMALVECSLATEETKTPSGPRPARAPVKSRQVGISPSPKVSAGAPEPASPAQEPAPPPKPAAIEAPPPDGDYVTYLRANWKRVLETSHGANTTVEALLRSSCEPMAFEDGVLVLSVYYPYHKERLEDITKRPVVEGIFGKILGTRCQVRYVLQQREKKPLAEGHLVKAAMEMGAKIVAREKNEPTDNASGAGTPGPVEQGAGGAGPGPG